MPKKDDTSGLTASCHLPRMSHEEILMVIDYEPVSQEVFHSQLVLHELERQDDDPAQLHQVIEDL